MITYECATTRVGENSTGRITGLWEIVPLTEGGGRGAVVEGRGTIFGETSTGVDVVSTEM